jgi:hypothetical protein
MPSRIQRLRTRGSRLPATAVYIGRPGRFGNPFRVGNLHTVQLENPFSLLSKSPALIVPRDAAQAVDMFRAWLDHDLHVPDIDQRRTNLLDALPSLAGRDLLCWCPLDAECHADVLLERANPKGKTT